MGKLWIMTMDRFTFGCLYAVLALSSLGHISGSTVCLSCKDVVAPNQCTTVEHCGRHSICFTEHVVMPQGYLRYNLGCRDSNQCSPHHGRSLNTAGNSTSHTTYGRQRRQNLICTECCKGNLCNAAGCKSKGYTEPHGQICYACASSKSAHTCDSIHVCGRDEACYIRQYSFGLDKLYATGCLSKTKCLINSQRIPGTLSILGRDVENPANLPQTQSTNRTKRTTMQAEHCCESFLCNNRLPVDGGWTSWSSWGHCSETCDGMGFRSRTRTCTNPRPVHGGNHCIGNSVDYDRTCSQTPCPHALVCLSCNSAASPRDCNKVEKCGPHSVCFLEHYVSANGYSFFFSGCRDKIACGNRTHTKRFFTGGGDLLCSECCTGNLCNSAGCHLPGYPNGIGPICYSCQQQLNPFQCDTIDICQPGQVCSMTRINNAIDTIYHSGCANKSTCHADGSCPRCCDKNLCNNDACGVAIATSTPSKLPLSTVSVVASTHHTQSTSTHHTQSTSTHPTQPTVPVAASTHQTQPVPSQWSRWTTWGACSVTCGSGLTMRNRTCIKTSKSNCTGDYMEFKSCQTAQCTVPGVPRDGGWSGWEPWGPCNEPKHIGTTTRYRLCDNPLPGPGGKNCSGSSTFVDIDTKYCLGSQSQYCTASAISAITTTGSWTLGRTMILHCKASGDPPPEIAWTVHTKDNVVRVVGDTATVIINNITSTHAGMYTCSAWNNCGHVARKIYNATIGP